MNSKFKVRHRELGVGSTAEKEAFDAYFDASYIKEKIDTAIENDPTLSQKELQQMQENMPNLVSFIQNELRNIFCS